MKAGGLRSITSELCGRSHLSPKGGRKVPSCSWETLKTWSRGSKDAKGTADWGFFWWVPRVPSGGQGAEATEEGEGKAHLRILCPARRRGSAAAEVSGGGKRAGSQSDSSPGGPSAGQRKQNEREAPLLRGRRLARHGCLEAGYNKAFAGLGRNHGSPLLCSPNICFSSPLRNK